MASSLRGIAIAVMQRAAPRAGDRILDGATGAIVPASPAILGGLRPIEVDVDRATLAIGRREVGAEIAGAEFGVLPFGANWFQVVVAVHSLQFAADPVGVLAEWRRVASSGARLSLSVPGPRAALGMSRYDHIYRRYGAGGRSTCRPPARFRAGPPRPAGKRSRRWPSRTRCCGWGDPMRSAPGCGPAPGQIPIRR